MTNAVSQTVSTLEEAYHSRDKMGVPASSDQESKEGDSCNNDNQNGSQTLEEELNHARVDAKETLRALLQFSEGVRAITRQMQSAPSDTPEECKEAEDDSASGNPSLCIERMVADTCLKGTVFGTDLLRLWDAAHHVRDYARLVSEESTISANDVSDAKTTAKEALRRAKKAESLALTLHRSNTDLKRQLEQLTHEKKCLVEEVKSLRQQAATTRKMDMERLLQQHVAGAILLHEEQLKAMATAAQQQQRKTRSREEEEKKEDDDLEVVKAEDCEAGGLLDGAKNALASPQRSKESRNVVVATPGREVEDKKPAVQAAAADKETTQASKKGAGDTASKDTGSEEAATRTPSPPSTPSSSYSPIKLLPSLGRLSPPPIPIPVATKPESSCSIASNQSNESANIQLPPEQQREHVGSKVFNFLFHPEKIAQQRIIELEREKQRRNQQPQERQPQAQAKVAAKKTNPLLALDDPEKEDASVDATAPTQAATTPGSSCPSLSRARSMSADKPTANEAQKPQPISNIIPNCVSFSDDTLSVQSNLPSPKFQASTQRTVAIGGDHFDSNDPPQDVELYKEFKMFRSLAIPADDEVDDYRQSRNQEVFC